MKFIKGLFLKWFDKQQRNHIEAICKELDKQRNEQIK